MVGLLQEIIDKENLQLDREKLRQYTRKINDAFYSQLDDAMLEYIKNIEDDEFELYLCKIEEIKKYNNFLKQKLR